MRRTLLLTVALLGACSAPNGVDGGTGGSGGGSGGGTGLTKFALSDLDATARDATYFAIAVDTPNDRVGVAYYTPSATNSMNDVTDYDLKYIEWKAGVVSTPQTIRYVQRKVGLSVAFDRVTGEPMVAYLGGDKGFVVGMSIFWFQSDAALAVRTNGTTWTEQLIATRGDQVTCGNAVSDRGLLVGVWPTIAYDAAGKFLYGYRDCHDGQFPQQDWGGSDVELWTGATPATATMGACVNAGGNSKQAWGGHLQLAAGDTEVGLVYDQMFGTADTNGQNVFFQSRSAAGVWSSAANVLNISTTQTGASLAWDKTEGFGIAVVDLTTNELKYTHRLSTGKWADADPVFGSGAGGWYPSLAMDPVNHEPAIAFYVCSPRPQASSTACSTSEDDLRVTQRIVGNWREDVVDPGGGYAPKIGFLSSGKRVVVYRVPPAIEPGTGLTVSNVGALKIAVER
jgi:hypothetical protein